MRLFEPSYRINAIAKVETKGVPISMKGWRKFMRSTNPDKFSPVKAYCLWTLLSVFNNKTYTFKIVKK